MKLINRIVVLIINIILISFVFFGHQGVNACTWPCEDIWTYSISYDFDTEDLSIWYLNWSSLEVNKFEFLFWLEQWASLSDTSFWIVPLSTPEDRYFISSYPSANDWTLFQDNSPLDLKVRDYYWLTIESASNEWVYWASVPLWQKVEILRIANFNIDESPTIEIDMTFWKTKVFNWAQWKDSDNWLLSDVFEVVYTFDYNSFLSDPLSYISVSGGLLNNTNNITLTSNLEFDTPMQDSIALWRSALINIPNWTEIKTRNGLSFDFSNFRIEETSSTWVNAIWTEIIYGVQSNKWSINIWIDWENLVFTKPVKLEMPIEALNSSFVTIYAKHNGDTNFGSFWLTNNPNATCNADWSSSPSSVLASVSWAYATIYTCSASVFWAFSPNSWWTLTTVSIFNDDLSDWVWSDYNNEQGAINSSGVILLRTKVDYLSWSTLTLDLSDLVWTSWSATWTVSARVVSYTGSQSNSTRLLTPPDSVNWTEDTRNFEDNLWNPNRCSLSSNFITCNVPIWEVLPKYTWIMLSWIEIINDSIVTSGKWDSSVFKVIVISWTTWDQANMRVALIRSSEQWRIDWESEGSATLDVEILSNISISVEQPENLIIQPSDWNSDRASSTWTITVITNSNGWYSVFSINDWWNTLKNIIDENIVIPELALTWTSWVSALTDAGFGICPSDEENQMCDFWTWTFYWVWSIWNELYQELDEEDLSAEITYIVDVPSTQKVGIYQGVITYLATVNL